MPHIIQQPLPILYTDQNRIPIHRIPAATDNIVYLIEYEPGKVAAVDGPDAQTTLDYCVKNSKTLTHVLNTHTHGDHIGINRGLKKLGKLERIHVVGSSQAPTSIPGLTHSVSDGDQFKLGKHTVRVLLTEGHINGHICFIIEDFLFCGDTLFTGGCGYLFDGPPDKMYRSLMRLAKLPGHTKVCCAHEYTLDNLWFAHSIDPKNEALIQRIKETQAAYLSQGTVVPSTVAHELATNPFLRQSNPNIVASLGIHFPELDTQNHSMVFAATRQLKDQKKYRQKPLPNF